MIIHTICTCVPAYSKTCVHMAYACIICVYPDNASLLLIFDCFYKPTVVSSLVSTFFDCFYKPEVVRVRVRVRVICMWKFYPFSY